MYMRVQNKQFIGDGGKNKKRPYNVGIRLPNVFGIVREILTGSC